jgi:hypothetical protein
MNISHSLPSTVAGVSFSFLTSQDVRRISVKQIVNPILLDDLNRPNIGGLYDPALGPTERSDVYVSKVVGHVQCLILCSLVARHAISPITLVLDTSDTLNCQHLYFTLCSWLTCTTFYARHVFSATSSS